MRGCVLLKLSCQRFSAKEELKTEGVLRLLLIGSSHAHDAAADGAHVTCTCDLAEKSIYFAHFSDASCLQNCAQVVGRLYVVGCTRCRRIEIDDNFILIQVFRGAGGSSVDERSSS